MSRPTVLVFLDPPASGENAAVGEIPITVLELITLARTLGRVDVVTLDAPSLEALATLGAYGVVNVHQGQVPTSIDSAAWRLPSVLGAVMTEAVRRVDADALLVPSSTYGAEAAAITAADLKAGLVTDAHGLEWETDGQRPLLVSKWILGGSWHSVAAISTDPAVVTVRANTVAAAPAANATVPEVLPLPVPVSPPLVQVVAREAKPVKAGRPDPATAAVVVAGGRGTAGDFTPIEDLAEVLGGAVGATRDAAFDGWWDDYIGQTGIVISPRLYVAAGISGAPHHVAGVRASQVIVAVNNDPDAPMVQMADFAVIGDLAEVLPAATSALRAHYAA